MKTIVTTELFRTIAEHFLITCIDVLTGFKYMGEQITLWEESFDALQYLFGAEESYGSLFGTVTRDKDAVIASCLIAEITALAKKQNLTCVDRLYQIYETFGVHRESLANLAFSDTADGMARMNSLMKQLREHPPTKIGNQPVEKIEDYQTSISRNVIQNTKAPLSLPKSDVLRFWLQDKSKLVIRPSGTEPKVKIYAEVVQPTERGVEHTISQCDERLKQLLETFKNLIIS